MTGELLAMMPLTRPHLKKKNSNGKKSSMYMLQWEAIPG